MSGEFTENSHPARKVEQSELKQVLIEKQDDLPALPKDVIAVEFQDVTPKTVKDNLDALADNDEICRFSDGSSHLYWYPRENDDAGDVSYKEVLDDSIDYSEIEPEEVPKKVAEEIALERLPYYYLGSLWSDIAGTAQLGIMFSFGMIILGIGELVSSSFGLHQETASLVLQWGFYVALFTTAVYAVSMTLNALASLDYVSKDPYPKFRKLFH